DGGFVMHLRRSELAGLASALGKFDTSEEGDLITLAEAVANLPSSDRAPLWELAGRRYGRGRPVGQAAAEIGMDVIHARDLLERFTALLAVVPPPEHTSAL